LRRQNVRRQVLEENKLRFDARGHETAAPAAVAAIMTATAALNIAGADLAQLMTWIFSSLVLLLNAVIVYSNLTAIKSVQSAFRRKADPELARVEVAPFLKAAENAFPRWVRLQTYLRNTTVFAGSTIALIAVTAIAEGARTTTRPESRVAVVMEMPEWRLPGERAGGAALHLEAFAGAASGGRAAFGVAVALVECGGAFSGFGGGGPLGSVASLGGLLWVVRGWRWTQRRALDPHQAEGSHKAGDRSGQVVLTALHTIGNPRQSAAPKARRGPREPWSHALRRFSEVRNLHAVRSGRKCRSDWTRAKRESTRSLHHSRDQLDRGVNGHSLNTDRPVPPILRGGI
jgi:hypothetical protein